MLDGLGYKSPPPPWPRISDTTNLARFIDTEARFLGTVVDLPALTEVLSLPPTT